MDSLQAVSKSDFHPRQKPSAHKLYKWFFYYIVFKLL